MNKKAADELIVQYQKKIFGFSMEKLRNIDEAEELAAEIVCQVYKSFLSSKEIVNVDGYVYRISQNVYATFLEKKNRNRYVEIMDTPIPYIDTNLMNLENEETCKELRREISYLSERQRTIIYMYYYKKMPVSQIAEALEISAGTVKWHLSDARENLKEEIYMSYNDNLKVNPILFISKGHNGMPRKRSRRGIKKCFA